MTVGVRGAYVKDSSTPPGFAAPLASAVRAVTSLPILLAGRITTPELAERIRHLVESHPRVSRCRDVELSSREGRITAHVVAEMPGRLSLEEAHEVETELEARLRQAFPELHEIVARATV